MALSDVSSPSSSRPASSARPAGRAPAAHPVPAASPPGRAGRHVERRIEDPSGVEQRVCVHIGESPLSWLRAHGHLDERLALAGDRLREDWERAGLGARVTMGWSPVPAAHGARGAAPGLEDSGRQIAARQRMEAALAAAGPGLRDILWRVACAGEGVSAAEKALGWPARAGKLVLVLALERVADYYRIA